jgi:hypothetical protein
MSAEPLVYFSLRHSVPIAVKIVFLFFIALFLFSILSGIMELILHPDMLQTIFTLFVLFYCVSLVRRLLIGYLQFDISSSGIIMQMYPKGLRKSVDWDNIQIAKLVKYNSFRTTYVDWGRLDSIGKQKIEIYSTNGDVCLLIVRKNEARAWLIAVNGYSEIEAAFRQAGKLDLLINEISKHD